MESNESDTAAESPEDLTKKSQESDSTEKQTHIRFLVYEWLVGSVIGKGGSTITQFQENSGAQIQVSRNREYFPGTACRIVLIFGTTKQVLTALKLVLDKLHSERLAEGGSDVELRRTRIVVRHCSCGGIIGRGGATIRSFIEDSKAGIKISPLENNKFFGLSDRLVTLSGTMEDQMRAIALILTKLTEDDDYSQQVHPGGIYNIVLGWRRLVKPPHKPLGSKQNNKEDNFNLVTIGVPDAHIGVVIGRGGRRIVDTSVFSGARIKVSGRGGFIPGTTDRKVTISGTQGSIDVALSIIERNVDVSKRAYG